MPIEDGILSTDGWTLIDDSKGLLFDDSEWVWVTERPSGEGQDWYFMAYGHNYKAALKDFTTFAGKVAKCRVVGNADPQPNICNSNFSIFQTVSAKIDN